MWCRGQTRHSCSSELAFLLEAIFFLRRLIARISKPREKGMAQFHASSSRSVGKYASLLCYCGQASKNSWPPKSGCFAEAFLLWDIKPRCYYSVTLHGDSTPASNLPLRWRILSLPHLEACFEYFPGEANQEPGMPLYNPAANQGSYKRRLSPYSSQIIQARNGSLWLPNTFWDILRTRKRSPASGQLLDGRSNDPAELR